MRIILGSSSFGFGPISKLTAIGRALAPHQRILLGDAVATGFADRNPGAFDEVVVPDSQPASDALIRGADYVISVMDSDLVFRALALNRPVMFVDSLFAFWLLERSPAHIAHLCATVRQKGYDSIEEHLGALSGHERQYAAHLLADVSAVQNFPGVVERLEEIRGLGAERIHLVGSIVDDLTLKEVTDRRSGGPDLLLSLGGFKNFLLDFERNNEYLRLFSRWMPDLLTDWPQFDRVVVCSGGFAGSRAERVEVAGRSADLRCLSQPEFMRALGSARHCMMTPGLTAIHEATVLNRLPMALPEEHYGHIANLAGLRGTFFEKLGSRFSDMVPDYRVPDDDFIGTAAIVDQIRPLLTDERAYARFRRGMNERFEEFFALSSAEEAAGVAELRELFAGPNFADMLNVVFDPR
ncbi:hypothetical protein [Catellatospora methionotrophica]|uniref:hypothetical protein n=1 Tax=Catellatospora methionotrophica TaxID=121620 RepID=UPI003411A50A